MGNNCCIKDNDIEDLFFNEFWSIKLRTITQKEFIDFIMENRITEEDQIFKGIIYTLIKEYLSSYKTKYLSLYENFWIKVFTSNNIIHDRLYELLVILTLLCIRDINSFEESLSRINNLFPKYANTVTFSDFLLYYFSLISIYSLTEIGTMYDMDKDQLDSIKEKYDTTSINLYIKSLTKKEDNLRKGILKYYNILTDDTLIRDNIKLISRKLQEGYSDNSIII